MSLADSTEGAPPLPDADHFFELSHDLVCTATFDGYFERVNSRWEELLGWSLDGLRSHADEEAATRVAESLRETIGEQGDPTAEDGPATTASVGVALFPRGSRRASAEDLMIEADVAMYRAKEAGRDRVAAFGGKRRGRPA